MFPGTKAGRIALGIPAQILTHDLEQLLRLTDDYFVTPNLIGALLGERITNWRGDWRYVPVGTVSTERALEQIAATESLFLKLLHMQAIEGFWRAREMLFSRARPARRPARGRPRGSVRGDSSEPLVPHGYVAGLDIRVSLLPRRHRRGIVAHAHPGILRTPRSNAPPRLSPGKEPETARARTSPRQELSPMRAICSVAALAACLAVPAARATAADVPAGYFSTVFSTYALTDADPFRDILPGRPSFTGFAVWGQRAGTTGPLGYTLLLSVDVAQPAVGNRIEGTPYGQVTVAGRRNSFPASNPDAAAPGFYSIVGGGAFPEFYVEGAPASAFRLETVGFEYNYGTGAAVAMTDARLAATVVPEPATLALTFGGLSMLGAGAWRRRRAA